MKKIILLVAVMLFSSNTFASTEVERNYCNSVRDLFLGFNKAISNGTTVDRLRVMIKNRRPGRSHEREAQAQQLVILYHVIDLQVWNDLYKTQQRAEDLYQLCMEELEK